MTATALDVRALRAQCPLLERELAGQKIAYLDSASTTPKPRVVLDAIRRYYEQYTANVHRGVHPLASEASAAYEEATPYWNAPEGSTETSTETIVLPSARRVRNSAAISGRSVRVRM